MNELKVALKAACQELFGVDVQADLTRPEEKFGDYATNVALQLGKKLGQNPLEVAKQLAEYVKGPSFHAVEVAGPGFINIKLSDEVLAKATFSAVQLPKPLAGQEILVEFGNHNAFKEMHIGHLYQLIIGDAIASLLETNGANVKRLGYHGDVGRHVAQAIWGLQQPGGDMKDIGACYAAGAKAYEEDEKAKAEIQKINEHIYKHDDEQLNELYDKGRAQSLESFDKIYELLGVKYDRDYFESESTPLGVKFVEENRKVFKESDGALVFEGEKVGLHTRVFITSQGLATYETKDLGLAELKNKEYPEASRSIIITANEQIEYFKVMLAALKEIDPKLAKKTSHLANGFVSLSSGKMSSRGGNIYGAMDLLLAVKDAVHAGYQDSAVRKEITFAAVKYAFLKHRLGSDIVVDIKESIGLEGNSGPYLQYAFVRAHSILQKSRGEGADSFSTLNPKPSTLEAGERSLALKISEYPEVIAKATAELMPHHICTYLYELAQSFNRFYESNRVIGDPRQEIRLKLVESYANVLKNGLELLNITAPEHM